MATYTKVHACVVCGKPIRKISTKVQYVWNILSLEMCGLVHAGCCARARRLPECEAWGFAAEAPWETMQFLLWADIQYPTDTREWRTNYQGRSVLLYAPDDAIHHALKLARLGGARHDGTLTSSQWHLLDQWRISGNADSQSPPYSKARIKRIVRAYVGIMEDYRTWLEQRSRANA